MDEIFMDVHKNSNEIIKNLILMFTLQQIFQTCKIFSNFLARVESNEKIASFHNNNYFLNSYFNFFFDLVCSMCVERKLKECWEF